MYGNGPTALVGIRTILGLVTTIVDEIFLENRERTSRGVPWITLKKSDNSEVKTRRHLR